MSIKMQSAGDLVLSAVFLAELGANWQSCGMKITALGMRITERIARLVEGFLSEVAQTTQNDLDCPALEKSAMNVVCELGVVLMTEVLRRADEQAPEVVVNGGLWGNRAVSKGTYTT